MVFQSKARNPNQLMSAVRRHPFALFGLPFLGLVVGSSFALQTFTQTRYDYHQQKVSAVSKEEELGMSKERKKVDIREEYYRLNSPGGDSALDALSSTGPSLAATAAPGADPDAAPKPPTKKKRFSMAPTAQDDYEPVRVPRPEGVAEWGAVAEASEDAPIKGHRKEDRWV